MTHASKATELLHAERLRASDDLHAALDALEVERDRRALAEQRLNEIESSRAWRFWSRVRRLARRDGRPS